MCQHKDKEIIGVKLQIWTNPLNAIDPPNGIVNIVIRQIVPQSVNLDNAVAIEDKQMNEFQVTWPSGIYAPLIKKVVIMEGCK